MPDFLSAIRAKKLDRVAAAYAVAGWLLVQAAAIALPTFGTPAWALRTIIAIALIGFPVTLFVAWFLVQHPHPEAIPKHGGLTPGETALLGLLGAVVVLSFAQLSYQFLGGTRTPTSPTSADISKPPLTIALTPLRAIGDSPLARSLAANLTEKLQSALPNGPIEAISTDDAATLAGSNRDAAARELGVGLILGGDVEEEGTTIDVSLRLDDERRHVTLWSGQLNGPVSTADALATQAGHLALTVLSCASGALSPSGGLVNDHAIGLYFKACELDAVASPGQLQLAFQEFEALREVTHQAPNFAPAHAMLAARLVTWTPALPGDQSATLAEARTETDRALALDPNNAQADVALANLEPVANWAGREALLSQALAAHPDSPFANWQMGLLQSELGRLSEAVTYMQRAAAADPFDDGSLGEEARLLAGAGLSQQANSLLAELARRTSTLNYQLWGYELQVSLQENDWDSVSAAVNKGETEGWLRSDVVAVFRDLVTAAKTKSPAAIAKMRAEGERQGATHRTPADLMWSIFELSSIGLVDDAYKLSALYTPQPWGSFADTAFLFMPAAAGMRHDPRFISLTNRLGLLKYWHNTEKWPDFCDDPALPYSCKAEAARFFPTKH